MVAINSSLITLSALVALVSAAPQYSSSGSGSYGGSYGSSSSNSYGGSSPPSSNSYGGSSPPSSNSYGGSSPPSSNSYGGSSPPSYGSSNSYGGNSYDSSSSSSSTMMMSETSTSMMMSETSTSTMMSESATSTMMSESSMMMESSMMAPPPMPSYGSGSSSWGNNGYNSCVQQCMMQYPPPPSMYTPSSGTSGGYGGSGGSSSSGTTHTITVAPVKGVLRFLPFAVNASVGDTVRFKWGAGPHSTTSSSLLEPCNATSVFDSQLQNANFTFDQPVKSLDPQFFYCKVPGHCQKGMFGIINPPNAAGAATSVAMMMPQAANSSADMSAQMTYAMKAASSSPDATNWGASMSMEGMSKDVQQSFMENVMMTRYVMGVNSDQVKAGTLTPTDGTGLNVPMDITSIKAATSGPADAPVANAAAASGSSASGSSASASGSSATSSPSPSSTAKSGSPRNVASSAGAIAITLIGAAFFAL